MLSAEKLLPRLLHQDSLRPDVFSQPLAGPLRIVFANEDEPALTVAQVHALGPDPAVLLQRALDNLSARLTSMTGQEVSGIKFGLETDRPVFTSLKVGHGLESCLMLLNHVWEQLASQISGELIVGVPGRDRIMFTSSDHFEGQLAMRKLLDAAYDHAGPDALSRDLFVWRGGSWQIYPELSQTFEESTTT